MVDVFDPDKRSEVMRLIRSKDTKAELIAFSYLRKHKVYFQKNYRNAPGKPDIALPRKKIAVFIDGDFWHGKTFKQLKQRRPEGDFWLKKIARNMERDREQELELKEKGWQYIRVWEKEILTKRTRLITLEKIKSFLTNT